MRTDEGLRQALGMLAASGNWEGPLGRRVLEQMRLRAMVIAHRVCSDSHVSANGNDLADDIVGRAWEAFILRPQDILGSQRPWKVLATILAVAARGEYLADAFGTNARAARRYVSDSFRSPLRTDIERDFVHQSAGPLVSGGWRWDVGLRALHDELVREGAPPRLAVEAINAALDILGESMRRSWIHTRAYRDERLTRMLSHDQIRALIDLLIGSRREGSEGSAWLALRDAAQDARPLRLADVHPRSVRRVRMFVAPWVTAHQQVRHALTASANQHS